MSKTFEEWAFRTSEGDIIVPGHATEEDARDFAEWHATRIPPVPGHVVKRTVTLTDWEPADE